MHAEGLLLSARPPPSCLHTPPSYPCSGTCAKLFKSEVQFGHAGAKSGGESESAQAKNAALAAAGAVVPASFEDLEATIRCARPAARHRSICCTFCCAGAARLNMRPARLPLPLTLLAASPPTPSPRPPLYHTAVPLYRSEVYPGLCTSGALTPAADFTPPVVPLDLDAAKRQGSVRAPTHVVCTISDDRGEEPTYAGVAMSELIEMDANVGDAIGCAAACAAAGCVLAWVYVEKALSPLASAEPHLLALCPPPPPPLDRPQPAVVQATPAALRHQVRRDVCGAVRRPRALRVRWVGGRGCVAPQGLRRKC